MDKRLIAERFAKARGTYDREARVQQQVAEKMMRLVLQHSGTHPDRFRRIVEFGCGTGSYSAILLRTLKPDTLLLNDLCPEMEECVENLPSAGGSPQAGPSAGGTVVRAGLPHRNRPDDLLFHPAMVQRPGRFLCP